MPIPQTPTPWLDALQEIPEDNQSAIDSHLRVRPSIVWFRYTTGDERKVGTLTQSHTAPPPNQWKITTMTTNREIEHSPASTIHHTMTFMPDDEWYAVEYENQTDAQAAIESYFG